MIKKLVLSFFVLGFIFSGISYSADIPPDLFSKFVNIKGRYLGQTPPGVIPKQFAPFLMDYEKHHIHSALAFSPEGDEIYFSAYVNYKSPQRIFYTKMSKDGVWSKPKIASFSGVYHEGYPKMSPDGKRIYYYSKRPFKEGGSVRKDSQIFFVKRKKNGWSKAIRLVIPEGLGIGNYPSHFGKDGCFYIRSKMGKRDYKIFKGYINGNKIESVVKMDKPVTFDPKEEYMIQNKINWKTFLGHFEIAFKKKDGSWTESRPMGDTINSKQTSSRFPGFSPDGKYFFFSSYRSGYEKLYWVNKRVFEVFRKYDLNLVSRLLVIFENKGIGAVKKDIVKMKSRLSAFYPFSQQLLKEVAYRFLAKGKRDLVQKAIKLNISLYPKENFIIEKLLVSVLSQNEKKFMEIRKNFIDKRKNDDGSLFDKINVLAFDIMNGGFLKEAIKIYILNTDLFPKSSKAFDRMGRVYLRAKNKKEAIKSYKKALVLNSKNQDALKALKELKKK